jgi:hypothetical protein
MHLPFPDEVVTHLIELGINVHDYASYREAQLAEVIPILRTMYMEGGIKKTGLAA